MSVVGYKQTLSAHPWNVRFTPNSGHSEAQERLGLKKQTFNVRLAPNSGRKWVFEFMSAYDPKRTLPAGLGSVIAPGACEVPEGRVECEPNQSFILK